MSSDYRLGNSNSSNNRGMSRGRGRGRGTINNRTNNNNSFHHSNNNDNHPSSYGRGRGRGRGSSSGGSGNGSDRSHSRGRGRGLNSNNNYTSSWMEPVVNDDPPKNRSNDDSSISQKRNNDNNNKTQVLEDPYELQQKQIQEQFEKEEELKLQQLANEASNNNNADNAEGGEDAFTALFASTQNNEEESANQRRARRRARLKELAKTNNKEDMLDNDFGKKRERSLENDNETINKPMIQNQNEQQQDEENINKRRKIDEDEIMNPTTDVKDENDDDNSNNNDGNDSFDMFASTSPPPPPSSSAAQQNSSTNKKDIKNNNTIQQQGNDENDTQNYNDSEGYYKATIGELITFTTEQYQDTSLLQQQQQNVQFKVLGIVGKGVFSTVLKCTRIIENEESDTTTTPTKDVAMKLIRSNEVMSKAAEKEVRILRMLRASSSNGKDSNNHFIVKMLELEDFSENESKKTKNVNNNSSSTNQFYKQIPLLEYRNHTALLFEYMPNNLRQVLSKFGKNVGINLSSVKSYAKQLLLALKHLSTHGIIHADIKLDNILVTANWTTVKLCDFGSAFLESDEEYINHIPTPYLVSRFYRAPEIILGLKYDKMIDLWSVAVSLAELFTGNVFFAGRTNNDMIKRFMDSIGPFSNKMIRRHIAAFQKIGCQPHFEVHAGGGGNFDFRRQDFDKVTGKPIIRIVNASQNHNAIVPSKQISQIILNSRSGSDNRGEVVRFASFLSKCLALDPGKRMSINEALQHEFLSS